MFWDIFVRLWFSFPAVCSESLTFSPNRTGISIVVIFCGLQLCCDWVCRLIFGACLDLRNCFIVFGEVRLFRLGRFLASFTPFYCTHKTCVLLSGNYGIGDRSVPPFPAWYRLRWVGMRREVTFDLVSSSQPAIPRCSCRSLKSCNKRTIYKHNRQVFKNRSGIAAWLLIGIIIFL